MLALRRLESVSHVKATGFARQRFVLHEIHAVHALGAQPIVSLAVKPQISLVVGAIQSKRPSLMLDLESRSRATSRPIRSSELALISSTRRGRALEPLRTGICESACSPSGRISSGRDFSENPPPLPFFSPFELSFRVLLVERDVNGLLQDLGHVYERIR